MEHEFTPLEPLLPAGTVFVPRCAASSGACPREPEAVGPGFRHGRSQVPSVRFLICLPIDSILLSPSRIIFHIFTMDISRNPGPVGALGGRTLGEEGVEGRVCVFHLEPTN